MFGKTDLNVILFKRVYKIREYQRIFVCFYVIALNGRGTLGISIKYDSSKHQGKLSICGTSTFYSWSLFDEGISSNTL